DLEGAQGNEGKPDEDRRKDRCELGEVVAEEVDEELADVRIDGAAELDGGGDGGKRIVEQDHDRSSPCDIGAALTHRHADTGALQRWGVIDAVSRDGNHLAAVLESPDDAHLVLGPCTREEQ